MEEARGQGKTREQAVQSALTELGLTSPGEAEISIIQPGTWFRPWVIKAVNLPERLARIAREAEYTRQSGVIDELLTILTFPEFNDMLVRELDAPFVLEVELGYQFHYPDTVLLPYRNIIEAFAQMTVPECLRQLRDVCFELPSVTDKSMISQASETLRQRACREGRYHGLVFLVLMTWDRGPELASDYLKLGNFLRAAETHVALGAYAEAGKTYEKSGRLNEARICFERARRIGDALRLLERLNLRDYVELYARSDQGNHFEPIQSDSLDECEKRYLSKLKEYKQILGIQTDPKHIEAEEALEERFLYGELTKEEFEQLKTRRKSRPTSLTCEHCARPVPPDRLFCGYCGKEVRERFRPSQA